MSFSLFQTHLTYPPLPIHLLPPTLEPDLDPSSAPDTSPTSPHISIHTLVGLPATDTFRVHGTIHHTCLTILIDNGSTLNFIRPQVAKFLNLHTVKIEPLWVMVGNGSVLDCFSWCLSVDIQLQGHPFTVDLRLLPMHGVDVVLGVEWLRTLGLILTDYTALTMNFTHLGQPVCLRADIHTSPSQALAHQLRRMVHNHSTFALFHLSLLPAPSPDTIPQPDHPIPTIHDLLHQFIHIFTPPTSLPPPRQNVHHINLIPSSQPVNVRPYCYPHFQKSEIERQVSELLDSSLIQHSRNPFSSPVLLVKKKDGTWHMCVDYCALNSITVKDRFPLTIDELLDELGRASWFSKLDLRQGFHQILMADADVAKTAFRTHEGHYEYRVMPFGLCNAPSTFQEAMTTMLRPFLRQFATMFFDDILVYSATLTDHVHHLHLILQALTKHRYHLKLSKCSFAQRQLDYLGHVISGRGVQPEPSKIQAILDWPTPRTTKELCTFLGLTGFYRKFVQGYAAITTPLTSLLCKDAFRWMPES